MKQNLNELRTVIKTEKIERSLPLETLENSLTGHIFKFTFKEEAQTSEEQKPSMLDDIKQDFTNDLKNVMKIEKIESSLHSETPEITSTGHTVEEFSPEETLSSEEQNPSMLDDIKQDFTNDLKNAINIEKIEFILHSETPQIFSIGHTIEQSLAEETQKKKVNQIKEMTLNQHLYAENTSKKDWYVGSTSKKDLYAGNTSKKDWYVGNTSKKDLYAGSLKDEGHVSYYNGTHQLVYAEEKAGLFQMGTETISSSFKANKYGQGCPGRRATANLQPRQEINDQRRWGTRGSTSYPR
ncbi:zinc finger protein 501-like isoform X2 [Biomphalaria pfeifferi]|uniref:Zinc finger protein 501-like isoform X2 n=1 Tax=Biomphalaria pfeifferi TaxID=112525 RepID=A0AAD8BSQ3_BIOPF|nr:zinc finger protein 501-like isoform X2 [Biomphalaria pfeifferi]